MIFQGGKGRVWIGLLTLRWMDDFWLLIACLMRKMGISAMFQYIHVTNLIKVVSRSDSLLRPLSELILRTYLGSQCKLLSRYYQALFWELKGGIDRAKDEWGKDLEEHISFKKWRKMSMFVMKLSRENCYKLQHMWYWTPVRVNKLFPESSARSW